MGVGVEVYSDLVVLIVVVVKLGYHLAVRHCEYGIGHSSYVTFSLLAPPPNPATLHWRVQATRQQHLQKL